MWSSQNYWAKTKSSWSEDRGKIDGGCDGKNTWDDNIRTLVPQMFGVNIIHYDE